MLNTDTLFAAVFTLGILVLSAGVFLASRPAGLVVLGAAMITVPILYARGGMREP